MLYAAKDVVATGGIDAGRLLLMFGFGEETKNTTMGGAVEAAGDIDAAMIGEPTGLDFAIAQRGLMMVDLLAQGDQRHAGYASSDGEFYQCCPGARAATSSSSTVCSPPAAHPLLGRATATPTMLEAGVSRNVTPPVARAVLDVRSTPDWTHEELAEELRRSLTSDVIVTSRRLVPCETPADSRLLATASQLRPEARHFGSPTCSDWVFFRDATRSSAGPAPAGGRTPRTNTWTFPRSPPRGPSMPIWSARTWQDSSNDPLQHALEHDRSRSSACSSTRQGTTGIWDARLLRWDVLGSLGHIEGLKAGRLITGARARRAAPRVA